MQEIDAKHIVSTEAAPPRVLFGSSEVQTVGPGNIIIWLTKGWDDLKTAPVLSLAYGVVFALFGILLSSLASNTLLVGAAAAGFFLVGPFLALGLYDISRSFENNEKPTLFHSATAIKHNALGLGLFAVALLVLLVVWIMLSVVLLGVFYSSHGFAGGDFMGLFLSMLSSVQGIAFLVTFVVVGFLFAQIAFTISVVTVPMLLDRKVDIATAISTSFYAVLKNPITMFFWALSIVLLIGIGIVTYFIGLIVTMPLVAHASWHAYTDLVAPASATETVETVSTENSDLDVPNGQVA